MTSPIEEKLCDQTFVKIGTLKECPSRGLMFAGAKTLRPWSSGERYLHERLDDIVLFNSGAMKPHPTLHFEIIGNQIVWQEGEYANKIVRSEDGREQRPECYDFMDFGGKVAFVAVSDDGQKFVCLDFKRAGPSFSSIFDLTQTPDGIAYTAFSKGDFFVMHNDRRTDAHHTHKPFLHKGKIGVVKTYYSEDGKKSLGEQLFWDGKPASPIRQEAFRTDSIHEHLIYSFQKGNIFISGVIEKGPLAGGPMFDLTSGFGYEIYIDGEQIGFGDDPRAIGLADGTIGIGFSHSKKLCDPDEWTEALIWKDGQVLERFKFEGRGYFYNIGGKLAYLQHTKNPRIMIEGKQVGDAFKEVCIFSGLIDLEGHVGALCRKHGDDCGYYYPTVDGKISGEPVPTRYSPRLIGGFEGNVVLRSTDIYSPQTFLNIEGKTHGPFLAISEPLFMQDSLRVVISKEDGTYLWTFKGKAQPSEKYERMVK